MIKILVTGADGQLGRCIKDKASEFAECDIFYASREDLDIENNSKVVEFFRNHSFDYCINAAAYTNVEKAESQSDAAFSANAEAVKYLSEACKKSKTVLVHISTDYVFDGKKGKPYIETDPTNPINAYGASKLKGEQYIETICDKYFIFRTSWLYSQYGHNFLNTILRFAREGKPLTITTEQVGTPTNANDLAKLLLRVITSRSANYGLYHFSNNGEATWYDFARAILENTQQLETTKLAKTDHYRTFAARPKYSVLDTNKVEKTFRINMVNWHNCLQQLLNSRNLRL
jgi:dTDP-4-dehydrorhamnose reductase